MSSITRRDFIATSGALAVAGCASTASNPVPEQPNILVILVDQHRAEGLGASGNNEIRTPHIDSLARDGVRYANCFCTYPVCTPSRYSFISGLYVHEHNGWNNHSTLSPDIETFPGILRANGYKTKCVGKMHYTPTYLDVGFSEMVLSEQNGPGRWDDDYHRMLREEGLIDGNDLEDQEQEYRKNARPEYWDTFGALPSNLPPEFHSTTWIGDQATDTIKTWRGGGHLLVASFIKPHHPFDPPADYAERYTPDDLSLLPGWTDACFSHDLDLQKGYFGHESLSPDALLRVMAYYYAGIEHIDDQVGRMIGALKRTGLYDSTMIVYSADHGEYLGYHHMLLKGNYMYDPVARVPLIVKYPSSAKSGAVSDDLVSWLDLAPTILGCAGQPAGSAMHGLDLGGNGAPRTHVFAESGRGEQVMVRTANRKLLLHRTKNFVQFYDIEKDPNETSNRIGDAAYREEVDALAALADGWRSPDLLGKPFLDEDAPVIQQPNVPDRTDNHRAELQSYTQEMMAGDWWS